MAKNLPVVVPTAANFREFGTVITDEGRQPDGGTEDFTWWERLGLFRETGDVSINLLEAKKREFKVDKLEYHSETPEAIIPLGGSVILVVAPAGELDESRIKAFLLEGKGVILNKGVRHFIPYPLKGDVQCLIVFKDATGANDLTFNPRMRR